MNDEYLSREQLAKLLHCCVRTIHNYEKTGVVPAAERSWSQAPLVEVGAHCLHQSATRGDATGWRDR